MQPYDTRLASTIITQMACKSRCRLYYDIDGSVTELNVRRICESHGLEAFGCYARAGDEVVPQATKTMVRKYAQDEKKRLGNLKVSTPADRMRCQFQRNQGAARRNAQFAMRAMQDPRVRVVD